MNTILQHLFKKEYRWQLLFWGIVFLEAPVMAYIVGWPIPDSILFRAVGLVTKMGMGYALAFYLIPEFLFKRRYLSFISLFILASIFFVILARILNVHVAERILGIGAPYESVGNIIADYKFTFGVYFNRVFAFTYWFVLIKIGMDQWRSQQLLARLSKEKAEAELSFLKAQIHPHFLFNTLNNLYTLTLEKSDEAPEVVVKLSEMLDYLLYQCNADRVAVQKEIDLINNYIGLEALRYGDRLDLSFEHELDDSSAVIAPLLLLSPIENAFKHGVSGTVGQPRVDVVLKTINNRLYFKVQNSKSIKPPTDERDYTAGIGLKNIKSQLELTYPGKYQLKIEDETDCYCLTLEIEL